MENNSERLPVTVLSGKAFWQTLNDPFPAWE